LNQGDTDADQYGTPNEEQDQKESYGCHGDHLPLASLSRLTSWTRRRTPTAISSSTSFRGRWEFRKASVPVVAEHRVQQRRLRRSRAGQRGRGSASEHP